MHYINIWNSWCSLFVIRPYQSPIRSEAMAVFELFSGINYPKEFSLWFLSLCKMAVLVCYHFDCSSMTISLFIT